MQEYVIGAIGGGVLAAVLMGAVGGGKSEVKPIDCKNFCMTSEERSSFLLMGREVESLRADLKRERQKCNLAETVEASIAEGKEREARNAEEARRQKAAAETKRKEFERLAKSGQLTISQWTNVLQGKNKAYVVGLIGKPTGTLKPSTSDEFSLEMWSYHNFVRLEESKQRRKLVIYFHKDIVQKAVASD